jgi:ABC-2 type transport system permease protein
VIADSFAGERERHTLETLLASRLSDRAILFGKAGAAVGYGAGLTWISLLLGLVTANLVHGQGRLLMYSLPVGAGIIALSLLGAGLAAGAGVLISLRAPSVRQAQQTLSFTIMLLLFVPVFGVQALPEAWKGRIFGSLVAINVNQALLVAVLILGGLNVLFLALAMARFQRAKLILD